MATKKYDSFKDLRKGKYDWKVTARVMNLWRGFTNTGQAFKSFNLLILDNKRCRIHAFVPGTIADSLEHALDVGKLYLFKIFTVKDYKVDDKFRCLRKSHQIVFSDDTKIIDLQENHFFLDKAVFDFFDLGDLKPLTKQTTYLTDVIGVIEEKEFSVATVKNGITGGYQAQIKFHITDGSNTVKVTFWDSFAELFADFVKEQTEYPLIIIIGCGRVTEWNDQINIANVSATTFYLNYDHHSVHQMRKMLPQPQFADYQNFFKRNLPPKVYTVQDIKNLGAEAIETEVICKLKIQEVPTNKSWFYYVCTSCYNRLEKQNKPYHCENYPREVPYPIMWFELLIVASDQTGEMNIILENKPTEKSIGYQVCDIVDEDNEEIFPDILKSIENMDYTIKMLINKGNIENATKIYVAKDLIEGHNFNQQLCQLEENYQKPIQESYAEPSGSTYHLDSISENN